MSNIVELLIKRDERLYLYCENCGKPLEIKKEYHQKWGTCNMYCYAEMVGVNLHEF